MPACAAGRIGRVRRVAFRFPQADGYDPVPKKPMKTEVFKVRKRLIRPRMVPVWGALALLLGLFLIFCFTGEPLVTPKVREYRVSPRLSAPVSAGARSDRLDVMTLNLAHGRKDGFSQILQSDRTIRGHLDEIAAVLRRESPDLVALQEADGPSVWSGNFNHVALLGESGGFRYSIQGAHVDGGGLSYGTALLSRRPIRKPVSVTFEPSPPTLAKGFVAGRVPFPGDSDFSVDVVSVHLDFARDSVREKQVREMVRILSRRPSPRIVMGDFNSEWDDPDSAVRTLAESLNLRTFHAGDKGLETFAFSGQRLDWILISPELEFVDYRVVPDILSDHRGVAATIARKRPTPLPSAVVETGERSASVPPS